MTQVSLQQIKKSYDGTTEVIKGVDLQIASGEFLVLVGPSGCGKSTLLRMIAGLEDITSGELHIGDRLVNDVPPRNRGIGMVFQSYALYPHMTVRENMGFGLKIRKLPAAQIQARVDEVSKMLDLYHLLDRLPKNLSGGQRQRVAMGRAIVRQPDVFLFDEPLSNLDAALRTQMRVELKKLHKSLNSTMIYVTHDQIEAMTLADRIMILNQGVVQQVGSPSEIFESPANKFVASFIGSPAMNFIDVSTLQSWSSTDTSINSEVWPENVNTIGIRPQHLAPSSIQPEHTHWIKVTVDVIEPMGWEAYVHVHAPDHTPMIAHIEMEKLKGISSGDTLYFSMEKKHLHFFDAAGIATQAK